MDFLDITFRIEKTLGISLSEEDLAEIVRDRDIAAGDLYDLLLKKLQLRDFGRADIRLNFELWSQMRSVLQSATNAPVEEIKLSIPLETLFPQQARRAHWALLRKLCPYRIRDLDYPHTVRACGLLLATGVVVIEQFQVWQMPGANWFWPVLGVMGLWMFGETYVKILSFCAPFRNRLPSGIITVKDLCRAVLATNYAEICSDVEVPLNQRSLEVWQELVEILVCALGVDADEVTFRSRLVRDLGMA